MGWLSCVWVAGQGSHQWCVAVTAGGGGRGYRKEEGREGGWRKGRRKGGMGGWRKGRREDEGREEGKKEEGCLAGREGGKEGERRKGRRKEGKKEEQRRQKAVRRETGQEKRKDEVAEGRGDYMGGRHAK